MIIQDRFNEKLKACDIKLIKKNINKMLGYTVRLSIKNKLTESYHELYMILNIYFYKYNI